MVNSLGENVEKNSMEVGISSSKNELIKTLVSLERIEEILT